MDKLPTYKELKNQFPINQSQVFFIEQSRKIIRDILTGKDSRLLLIIGPCSIHDPKSGKEFALHLKKLQEQVEGQFYLIMRAYCEKPRTAAGWKGFLYDPYLNGSNDLKTGISLTRQFLLDLTSMQVPIASEFLDPLTAFYYEDLVSWGSIGARTSSSQPHRQLTSSLQMPVGIKNGVAGNITAAINGVISANQSHTFMGLNACGEPYIIRTNGNEDAHVVLRGGDSGPNYDSESVLNTLESLKRAQLRQSIVIDCAHQNSDKRHDKQAVVFQSVINQVKEGNKSIRGLMIESHLSSGNQNLSESPTLLKYGISITDPCLDWKSTEQLILQGVEDLKSNLQNNKKLDLSFACVHQ